MHKTTALLISFLVGATSFAAEYDFSALDAHLNASLPAYENKLAVYLYRGDNLIYQFESGMTRTTKVEIASATKFVSGAVMLRLAQAGVFDLDDPIGDYVPLFNVPDKQDITIRHAFAMTHGMAPTNPIQSTYEISRAYTHVQSVNRIALDMPVAYLPGSTLYYDGTGMQAAGLAAVYATRLRDWQAVAEEFLLDELGMVNTSYTYFDPNPAVAGGLETTPDDYLRLTEMFAHHGLFRGKPILATKLVAEIFSPEGRHKPIANTPWPAENPHYPYGHQPYYGFGSWILADNPETGLVEEILSPGAFGTTPWIDRTRNLWGVVFTRVPAGTQTSLNPTLIALEIVRAEVDRVDATTEPPITPPRPNLTIDRIDDFLVLDWNGREPELWDSATLAPGSFQALWSWGPPYLIHRSGLSARGFYQLSEAP